MKQNNKIKETVQTQKNQNIQERIKYLKQELNVYKDQRDGLLNDYKLMKLDKMDGPIRQVQKGEGLTQEWLRKRRRQYDTQNGVEMLNEIVSALDLELKRLVDIEKYNKEKLSRGLS